MIPVLIPTPLRSLTGGARQVDVPASTVGEALAAVSARYPALASQILTDGRLRAFVNVFVNEANVRDLAGVSTPLAAGDVVDIIPSIAGG